MEKICSNCQTIFGCQTATQCWCGEYPPIFKIEEGQDCLCPKCLHQKTQTATQTYAAEVMAGQRTNEAPKYKAKTNQLTEGIDYYIQNGYCVFTAWFHLKRGTCCGSGCRHCPFNKIAAL